MKELLGNLHILCIISGHYTGFLDSTAPFCSHCKRIPNSTTDLTYG